MKLMMPSKEHLDALFRFYSNEGRCWKVALRKAWATGSYPEHVKNETDDLACLQQIRNTYGPDWLGKIQARDIVNLIVKNAIDERCHADYECYLSLREHADALIAGLDLKVTASLLDESKRNEIVKQIRSVLMRRDVTNDKVLKLACSL